jgi:hypothetical protein
VLKLLLLMVVLASMVIPALGARATNPVRGLRSVLLVMAFAEICYGAFLVLVYGRLT